MFAHSLASTLLSSTSGSLSILEAQSLTKYPLAVQFQFGPQSPSPIYSFPTTPTPLLPISSPDYIPLSPSLNLNLIFPNPPT